MEYLNNSSDEDWERVRLPTANLVMAFDEGNSKLFELLGELLMAR